MELLSEALQGHGYPLGEPTNRESRDHIRTIWPVSNLDCGDPETWDSVCVPEADTGGEQDGLVNR